MYIYIYTQTIPKSIPGLFSLQHLGDTWQMMTHHLPPGDCRSRPLLQLLPPVAGQLDSFSEDLILFSEVNSFKILKPFKAFFWCLRFWARFQIQFCGYRWNALPGSRYVQCKWGSLWLNRALCTHKWFLGRECTAWAQIFPMSPSTYVPSGYLT